MSERERPKLEWTDLKTFVDEPTGLAIRLQQGVGTGRPQYSAELGRVRDGKFLRFQRVQYDTDDAGTVSVQDICDFSVLQRLGEEVKAFVRDTQQQRENEFKQRRQERDGRGGGKKGRRVGTHGRFDRDERGDGWN